MSLWVKGSSFLKHCELALQYQTLSILISPGRYLAFFAEAGRAFSLKLLLPVLILTRQGPQGFKNVPSNAM